MSNLKTHIEIIINEFCTKTQNDAINIDDIFHWICKNYVVAAVTTIHDATNYILEWSSGCGHLEIVEYLLENKSHSQIFNIRALQSSATNGHLEIVKLLVEHGVDIHAKNNAALQLSSENGHFEIVKLLVERGANIHANENGALRWSSENNHLEIVKFLVECGANIRAKNDDALRVSARNNNVDVVDYLARKYIINGDYIPSNAPTTNASDANRILIRYAEPEQYNLFHPEIVGELSKCKSARNI